MSNVPMSHPATAVKNPDGTYTVRIQHTTEGSVTLVDFTNVLFAATLANAYADVLNGKAAVEAKVDQVITDAKPALADATADVKRLIADAEVEAGKLIAAARKEASTLKTEATALYEETKTEAEKLLADAREEASKILKTASEKVAPAQEAPAPAPTPAAKPVEEE